ncbi:helix-turn-helix domain-containing protein [Clostridium sp. 1001271B_151109_B4]
MGERTIIDIHVQRLREKLKLKENIKTMFKVGYRLED